MENDGFSSTYGFEDGHDEPSSEIIYKHGFLALLTQENGFDNMQIEIYNHKKEDHWTIPLDTLIKVINHDKKGLWDRRKIEQEDEI